VRGTWRKWLSDPPIAVPVSIIAQRLVSHRRLEIEQLSLARELLFATHVCGRVIRHELARVEHCSQQTTQRHQCTHHALLLGLELLLPPSLLLLALLLLRIGWPAEASRDAALSAPHLLWPNCIQFTGQVPARGNVRALLALLLLTGLGLVRSDSLGPFLLSFLLPLLCLESQQLLFLVVLVVPADRDCGVVMTLAVSTYIK